MELEFRTVSTVTSRVVSRVLRAAVVAGGTALLSAVLIVGAQARASEGAPAVSGIYTVAPNVLAVTIRQGAVVRGVPVPYVAQPKDSIRVDTSGKREAWLTRKGIVVGGIIGPKADTFAPFDKLSGGVVPAKWLDSPASYSLQSKDDSAYAAPTVPSSLGRKSKPVGFARTGSWEFKFPIDHTSFLRLPTPLKVGKEYTVTFGGERFAPQTFIWQPESQRSEAVHVSQVGFRPDDIAKVAFLSCWLGSGGGQAYKPGTPFHVVDEATGKRAFSGNAVLSKSADDSEDAYNTNYNGTDVYKMDFAALKVPGTYHIYVDGVGTSYPFRIAGDAWAEAFTLNARGFYHQRSGIALGEPYTDFVRPRSFSPEDGVQVFESTCSLLDSGNGLNALGTDTTNFGNLVAGATTKLVENAWGGYFDAGDWDRRIQHLDATRLLLELLELVPDKLETVNLNIPESANKLPDILDEALWNIDCFRRMQLPEGGIRGGIEMNEHPKFGERSWENSLTLYAYAPDCWSSYVYAGVAARAALLLSKLDAKLAATYSDSAVRAMEWGEKDYARLIRQRGSLPFAVGDSRNLAAAELYRLTGDAKWNSLFLATTVFTTAQETTYGEDFSQANAAFVYARLKLPGVDKEVQSYCSDAVVAEGETSWLQCQNTGFRWTKNHPWHPIFNQGTPKVVPLIRAHSLTGRGEFLRGAILATQYSVGANPMNTAMTTGMGQSSPQNPLWLDFLGTGQAPPPGLPVYGPMDPARNPDAYAIVEFAAYPKPAEWPAMETYFDVFWIPAATEFTVMETMGPTAYAFGYLAYRK